MFIVSYSVNKDLYNATEHQITMTTTEYTYKNNVIVHLHIGKTLGIRLNNILNYELNTNLNNNQYFMKKAYNKGKAKPTTRGTFEEKLKRFDMNKTTTEKEIVEEYGYVGKDGNHASVQIVVIIKNDTDMTATIDFKTTEQYENFIYPDWLTERTT